MLYIGLYGDLTYEQAVRQVISGQDIPNEQAAIDEVTDKMKAVIGQLFETAKIGPIEKQLILMYAMELARKRQYNFQ